MKKNKFEFIIDSEFQSQIPACSTGHLKTTMGAARRCTTHTAM